MNVGAEFPAALGFLFEPARYKVAYGGRAGAKSWGYARANLIQSVQKPRRVLCAREFQNSIKDSVHKLLADQINALGMNYLWEVQTTAIVGRGENTSEFSFAGLRHNVKSIKSAEGIDCVWVAEAQTVSKSSWEILIPTIRKPGSEIWPEFNPELNTDDTYRRFVVDPPPNAVVRKVSWRDNPWFPDVLRDEMEHLKTTDYDAYLHVWEGHCKQVLDGAIYAKEIRAAVSEGRICRVPYDRTKPVHTFWDLGRRDLTAIWFAQMVGFEFRVLDFYENRGSALDHYLRVLQERGYIYGDHWLPHDAENELLASRRTIAQQMREHGHKVRITPKTKVVDGIAATRAVFPNLWFDEAKCADGVNRLRRYRYDVDDNGQYSRDPLHDDNSNAADALRYLAVAMREPSKPQVQQYVPRMIAAGSGAWMA